MCVDIRSIANFRRRHASGSNFVIGPSANKPSASSLVMILPRRTYPTLQVPVSLRCTSCTLMASLRHSTTVPFRIWLAASDSEPLRRIISLSTLVHSYQSKSFILSHPKLEALPDFEQGSGRTQTSAAEIPKETHLDRSVSNVEYLCSNICSSLSFFCPWTKRCRLERKKIRRVMSVEEAAGVSSLFQF